MNCQIKEDKNHDASVLARNARFLFGFLIMLAGLYIATLINVQGHGLGLLLVFASPFIIFTDEK